MKLTGSKLHLYGVHTFILRLDAKKAFELHLRGESEVREHQVHGLWLHSPRLSSARQRMLLVTSVRD